MSSDWPLCPECGYRLVYIVGEKVFSCACGHVKPVPDFLKAAGITEDQLRDDAADVEREK